MVKHSDSFDDDDQQVSEILNVNDERNSFVVVVNDVELENEMVNVVERCPDPN